jgi:hypothetical protein
MHFKISLVVLMLLNISSCTSYIDFEYMEPNDSLALIVIDIPNASLLEIRSKKFPKTYSFYGSYGNSPKYVSLRQGEYILGVMCNRSYIDDEGEEITIIFTDYAPTLELSISSNKTYLVSCRPSKAGVGLFYREFTPNKPFKQDK